MGCGEQVTNWHYFIQSSFALHSLHFELSRISLSVSLDSLLYFYFCVSLQFTVQVHSFAVHDFLMHFSKRPEGFVRNTTRRAWGK